MATATDSTLVFFTKATLSQWTYVFSLYNDILKAKAARRSRKGGPEELVRMDTWYQEQLPKLIHSRKEPHITHEELIQITKWKLMRGRYRPNLIDLVRINTESSVIQNSKKAFKRMPNLTSSMNALTCLKGVGPASASVYRRFGLIMCTSIATDPHTAILAAAFPDQAPFMADESMLSTPGVETMDYTVAEYLNYALQLKERSDHLNKCDPSGNWNPHKIEMAMWVHFVAGQLKSSMLMDLPQPEELPENPNCKNKRSSTKDQSHTAFRMDTHFKPKAQISCDETEEYSSDNISNDIQTSYSGCRNTSDESVKQNNSCRTKKVNDVGPPSKKQCM